ncbi:hypothetical protein N9452_05340 [Alphaproteobacteria bacterium]|jgi:hypothetical protein|nr:hypothetical protein [Alphaproteobacteria bacterium]
MSRLPTKEEDRQQPKVWRSPWKRVLLFVVAWGLIFLGFLGILLPILPGMIFLVAGLYLLSLESLWLNRQLDKIGQRYPKVGEILDDARARAGRIVRRLMGEG